MCKLRKQRDDLLAQRAALLAACKEAYDLAEDRTNTYPKPCNDVTMISLMITLKAAIDKAESKESEAQ